MLQRWLDHEAGDAQIVSAFAGSAQHMMQGLALDSSSPLFGRAKEIFALNPLPANCIGEVTGGDDPCDKIRSFSVFGGVPRYWELAKPFGADLNSAVDALMLDPMGPLHLEPDRLLAMENPPATSLRSLLDVIGAGAHRVSEIGGRLGQPATALSRNLGRLCQLGFVKREKPFGEHERGSKRTLYRLNDPFLRTWFKTAAPHRAFLAAAGRTDRLKLWRVAAKQIFAETFEDMARDCVPRLVSSRSALAQAGPFGPAGRYWEPGGKEWDIVALSSDGKKILLGEVKWSDSGDPGRATGKAVTDLLRKGMPKNKQWAHLEPVFAVFVPQASAAHSDVLVIDAAEVVQALV